MTTSTTTQGPWIVAPINDRPGYLAIRTETDQCLAVVLPDEQGNPNFSNAALMATAPHMLEALVEVSEQLNSSKDTINLEDLNETTSLVFEKLAAEADA